MYLADPWKLRPTTCVAKVEVLDLQHLCLSNLLHTLLFNIFLSLSEHKTDGAIINNLAALQMNLLKRCVISEMNVSTIDMTRGRL